MHTVKEVLNAVTFRKMDIDCVLDRTKTSWVRFDPVLGYVPDDIVLKDGGDRSSIYKFEPTGERNVVNYRGDPCRINTYGDSFTFCQQVSDGQTWQEFLAADIGEPVRNYGNGGYGVYTAYRRALRMEATDKAAEYVLLGVYDDDHIRSLDAARWIRTQWPRRNRKLTRPAPLHGLPWAHVRYDLDAGRFVEKPGLCQSDDDLRALCDEEHFYETFKDDQIARLFTLRIGGRVDDVDDLQALAKVFGVEADLKDPARAAADAARLHLTYGMNATYFILDKMRDWAAKAGKKLMFPLFYSDSTVREIMEKGDRFDQPLIDYFERHGLPYVDMVARHSEDFKLFNTTWPVYSSRYYVGAAGAAVFGHYSPGGNFLAAMCIKDEVVKWLDPKPPAYRD